MERQDIKLGLIKANIIANKRKEDLAILLADTNGMDDDVKAWCPPWSPIPRLRKLLDSRVACPLVR
jgi:hypothetical protein